MAKADAEISARAGESEKRIREIRDSALTAIEAVADETTAAVIEAILPDALNKAAVKSAVRAQLA